MPCLRSLPSSARKHIKLRGREVLAQREVTLQIAWQSASLCAPRLRTGATSPESAISGYYIRCWEERSEPSAFASDAMASELSNQLASEPLEWLLFTTIAIDSKVSACNALDWYSCRWLIEEYHKCLKTGCSVERRQLHSGGSLRALLGFVSLVGLRLLWLRSLSREYPGRPASSAVPKCWLALLKARHHIKNTSVEDISLGAFWGGIPRLGGFIGRKCDGAPGWQTLWRGWFRFQDMLWAAAWTGAIPEAKCG